MVLYCQGMAGRHQGRQRILVMGFCKRAGCIIGFTDHCKINLLIAQHLDQLQESASWISSIKFRFSCWNRARISVIWYWAITGMAPIRIVPRSRFSSLQNVVEYSSEAERSAGHRA